MTTGIQCQADRRCEVPAPAETGICHCHAEQADKAGATIPRLSRAGQASRSWSRQPDKELEP
jgi:hypothetical protein